MQRLAIGGGGLVDRTLGLAREAEAEEAERHLREVLARAAMPGIESERLAVTVGGGARLAGAFLEAAGEIPELGALGPGRGGEVERARGLVEALGLEVDQRLLESFEDSEPHGREYRGRRASRPSVLVPPCPKRYAARSP
jgi:hypothetical protein